MSSAVNIVSAKVIPNVAGTILQWNASICRHNDGVMGTDFSRYVAIVSIVAFKRRILLALLILKMKIGLSLPIADHARLFFS